MATARSFSPPRRSGQRPDDGSPQTLHRVADVEYATLDDVDWFNHRRLHGEIGMVDQPSSKPPTAICNPRRWPRLNDPSPYETRAVQAAGACERMPLDYSGGFAFDPPLQEQAQH